MPLICLWVSVPGVVALWVRLSPLVSVPVTVWLGVCPRYHAVGCLSPVPCGWVSVPVAVRLGVCPQCRARCRALGVCPRCHAVGCLSPVPCVRCLSPVSRLNTLNQALYNACSSPRHKCKPRSGDFSIWVFFNKQALAKTKSL